MYHAHARLSCPSVLNLEWRIPNPAYVGRCDGGHAVSVSATQAPNQIVVFSKI